MSNLFKVGMSVIVKKGIVDPDDNKTNIGGWCGRITEIDHDYILIEWDSVTLQNISFMKICFIEDIGLDWSKMYLVEEDIEQCEPRDTFRDVSVAVSIINDKLMKLNVFIRIALFVKRHFCINK